MELGDYDYCQLHYANADSDRNADINHCASYAYANDYPAVGYSYAYCHGSCGYPDSHSNGNGKRDGWPVCYTDTGS
jgi:hypothetical protein